MAITNVAQLIKHAILDLGGIGAGESPSQSEYDDALDILNLMLLDWSTDETLLPRRSYDSLTVSTNGVSIGPGQTLVTTGRVTKLLDAVLRHSSVDQPLLIKQWPDYQKIQNKSVSGMPRQIYLNPGVLSAGALYFDRVPDQSYTLRLDTLEHFGTYSSISADMNLPDEYDPALLSNLKVKLSNQYPGLTPQMAAEAKRTKEHVQYLNQGYLIAESTPHSMLIA